MFSIPRQLKKGKTIKIVNGKIENQLPYELFVTGIAE